MTLSINTLEELQRTVSGWREKGESVALVPTMGALHAGHMQLVAKAKEVAKRVIVSIFVNPTQFGPNEDLSRYPRPLEHDLGLLQQGKVDAVWLPTVEIMYPQGTASDIHIEGISEILEGAFRPGHFDGVATVVNRLFRQVTPDIAAFGEKDYQQLCLIERLVKKLDIKIKIIAVPTVRHIDGLAMSSRNQYLSQAERKIAPKLVQWMQEAVVRLKKHESVEEILTDIKARLLKAGFSKIDYLELRAENTLAPLDMYQTPSRLLAAVYLGKTRLIDNLKV